MRDLVRYRGDTEPIVIKLWADKKAQVLLDITGYTFVLTVDPSSAPANADANILQLTGQIDGEPTAGVVRFDLTEEQANIDPGNYHYDLQITDASGYIKTAGVGRFVVNQDISK